MKHTTLLVGAAIAATAAITAGSAHAADKWWPAKYYNLDFGLAQGGRVYAARKSVEALEYLRAVSAHEGHLLGGG